MSRLLVWLRRAAMLMPLGSIAFATPAVQAINPAIWDVSLATDGEDVFWTSPTSVNSGFSSYEWSYEITRMQVFTFLLDPDVTEELGDSTTGSGSTGSLPATFFAESFVEETTGSAAILQLEIDADGFGRAAITDVTLGSLDIGPIQVQINRVEIDASVTVMGIAGLPGDYDGDGTVSPADYDVWKSTLGSTSDLRADGNQDGQVTASDFTIWRDKLTTFPLREGSTAASIPEPGSWLLLAMSGIVLRHRRLR